MHGTKRGLIDRMRRLIYVLFALVMALSLSLMMVVLVSAAVTVTSATGGGAISADTSAGAPSAA